MKKYRDGIAAYLKDKGSLDMLVDFDWGYEALVDAPDGTPQGDPQKYTFQYQGEDQFSVELERMDWENEPEDDFAPMIKENKGFITVKCL